MRTADISRKPLSLRSSKAYGRIRLGRETIERIRSGDLPKGNLLEATRLAGIMGAKKTGDLLPFCHPVEIAFAEVRVKVGEDRIEVFSEVRGVARTGFEMEALSAVSTALLNVYDMCKGIDESMVIEEIRLLEKSGGKSDWSGTLKGRTFEVLSSDRALADLVRDHLEGLGAVQDEKGNILVVVGDDPGGEISHRLSHLESVVALYDFAFKPDFGTQAILIGLRKGGGSIVVLPEDRERIRAFFETFGALLGDLP